MFTLKKSIKMCPLDMILRLQTLIQLLNNALHKIILIYLKMLVVEQL